MKKSTIIATIIGVIVIGFGFYYFLSKSETPTVSVTPGQNTPQAQVETPKPADKTKTIIGKSVEKRDIAAYHYGDGSKEIVFVAGIHGGYEWNTPLLAYELMDYLSTNQAAIPKDIKVTVIPVLNPDGLYKVTGKDGRFVEADVTTAKETRVAGRFNAHTVDLNRNFDCKWQPKGTWMQTPVSGGASAFSEPESQAFKSYIDANKPRAVITWFSSAGGVFSANCDGGPSAETRALNSIYAKASGYKTYESYDFYETTGDITSWLAKKNIPAISILLTTHQDTEWSKNLAGIKAVLASFAK